MRDYSKISPAFWTGKTGRELRSLGPDCQVLAFYLITCHHATMLGLYYLPVAYIANDTGMTIEGALKGLASLSEAGFCKYDAPSEWVFVVEMARFQILSNNEPLDPKDKRVIGIFKEYSNMPSNPFLFDFYEKYSACFHLNIPRGGLGYEAPSKPLRSQEQEQEQEHKQDQDKTSSASVQSFTETQIRECLASRTAFIAEQWPHYNLAVETEEIVAKYRDKTLGADPWLIISRWFKKLDVAPGASSVRPGVMKVVSSTDPAYYQS